ncbi:glycerol-3-phosphate acyltransferase 2, mitochondrial [Kryptolebias marmoratus]|uniref:glycerol-3-phosphate acyltransferase 2, mitochondrial n=1 Tax=Kryptolebias marmoratus TaxID=37003 RepID=UPI000D52F490|nr:glycerol-3-phosphate acyltransferase 2, mitochondrial [Kryptolebias marmoratus]XP_024860877.1 glycerol-3-phosphate acyltransferase 2, mitochondrial [Kryptolebias marmoratus]XP_024860878.1 glycerol-3-phosphate acyltransferase 2, mitochondrial [Kryptolebias marmoratus]XP_024860881.1 glycerol-3-phosphate acyltransferase 2, mitochondrial [Kryptolebias marmoratus]XP_024860882.1 glycerol-3-phosphate acyltransferase 2, mitochondrial [Kryptolebias marmoratus]XP_024860883.1 glycerol-3-phosphate acyl
MVQEKNDGINNDMSLPPIQQKRPALSWELKIKKKVKIVPSFLGKLRPAVGQCCHQCTPDSLRKKLGQNSFPGFRNLLNVNETQTRYRGWLVRRVCCVLFVSGCKVYGSPVSDRLERVCQSNRVKEALAADHKTLKGNDSQGQFSLLPLFLPLINTCVSPGLLRFLSWVILKVFASMFGSIQVNLNHLPALHKASQEGAPLVYVYVRHSAVDFSLIPLVLFCHNLRVPYTLCPPQTQSSFLRAILQKVGVVLLPPSLTELEAEGDPLYSAVMTSLLHELLHEGQVLSVGVSAESGLGGRWLARVRQLIKEGSVPDVSLVPVGISYDRVTKANIQVGLRSALLRLFSAFWKNPEETVRIDFAQPFSLKEMCESGMCRVDEWLPLQDLLLPVILNNRSVGVFGKRRPSWLLPSCYGSELEGMNQSDRDLDIAIILHLIYSTTSCLAVMSTSLVSSLLLYRHRKGASASVLCRDVAWLTEELLFRNRDVGFGGSLPEVVHYSLTLLAPHLIIAASPSRKDPLIVPRPSSALHLSLLAQTVVQTFILEAVGACAVSAMLCEVVFTGVSSRVRTDGVKGEGVKGDMEFDVVLGQSELAEKALRLCHLLPSGVMPPCQSTQSFALDAVDSLVRCGILIMEEISRDAPICDFMKREGALTWTTTDDPYHSDSDCEEQELRSYKISQPSQCPDMLFFLCSMLAGHLRTLCWTVEALDLMDASMAEAEFVSWIHSHLCDTANQKKQHYESCSEEAAHTAVRTLIDLGVLSEERQTGGNFLGVSPLFQLSENREKLQRFISQYLYN